MKTNKSVNPLLVLGTIIVQMGIGTIYSWSLFNQLLENKFGWELSSVAITFSISSFSFAFSTLFTGKVGHTKTKVLMQKSLVRNIECGFL